MIRAVTTSADDTQALGQALSSVIQQRDIVLLAGDLGSGKTTFTQGLGVGLGIDEAITSPTFVLMRSYEARIRLHHVDVYRMENLQEVIDLGLLELLDEGGVALIEWGDMAAPAMPRDFLEVRLTIDEQDDDRRSISLHPVGQNWSIREKVITETLGAWVVPEEAR